MRCKVQQEESFALAVASHPMDHGYRGCPIHEPRARAARNAKPIIFAHAIPYSFLRSLRSQFCDDLPSHFTHISQRGHGIVLSDRASDLSFAFRSIASSFIDWRYHVLNNSPETLDTDNEEFLRQISRIARSKQITARRKENH